MDLLNLIGPQSDEQGRYARWYGELAEAFADRRASSRIVHPRLVLMEVNLSRENVKRAQRNGDMEREERLNCLRDAEQLLLRTLEEGDTSPRGRLNLYVELASSIGSQVFELVSEQDSAKQGAVSALVDRLVEAVMRAREADPENIYPVDVLAWTARDAVVAGNLDPESKLNLLADAKASLDSLDPEDLSPGQQAKYRARQANIAKTTRGQGSGGRVTFKSSVALGNPAAYYLLASRAANSTSDDAVQIALQTLLAAPASIRDDLKVCALDPRNCIGSTEPVPGSSRRADDRPVCAIRLGRVPRHGGVPPWSCRVPTSTGFPSSAALLYSTSAQSLRRKRSSGALVRLAWMSVGAFTWPTWPATPTHSKGVPGRVASATPDGRRGKVWVDQLRAEVDFVPLRFSPDGYRSKNEVVPTFHIGFNYETLADPIRHAGRPAGPRPS